MGSRKIFSLLPVIIIWAGCAGNETPIQPWVENPAYWEYHDGPILLLGGSVEDNLFQVPDVEGQLDLLVRAGGNYVRCTMSSRDEGNVWPYLKDPATGLYDLKHPNPEYWSRFERFLNLAVERDIIVQIEVWATFDYYRDNWAVNPFNPKNNINYTAAGSGLPAVVETHPTRTENDFFRTVPAAQNNDVVLPYQEAFVEQILSHGLPHGNILYCMDNETSVTLHWGAYWANFIRAKVLESVPTTEMWDPWDLAHEMHSNTFDHPEIYTFVDISQNNHQKGQTHWDNAQKQRQRIQSSGKMRPLNNVKIYGADTGRFGTDRDGLERFWRNILGGLASARFHRPLSGQGLNTNAQANIRSLRMLTDSLTIFTARPHNDLLAEREENETYCSARPGEAYAVYFPRGGEVNLDISAIPDGEKVQVRWLEIMSSTWQAPVVTTANDILPLAPPDSGYWAVLVRVL